MEKRIGVLCSFLFLCASQLYAQQLKTYEVPDSIDNVFVKPIYSDSFSSVFFIAIKREVKSHKHMVHTETIMILAGKAILTLGDSSFKIRKGQTILIPRSTPHSVKVIGRKALTLYSIQSPRFLGKDRIWLN